MEDFSSGLQYRNASLDQPLKQPQDFENTCLGSAASLLVRPDVSLQAVTHLASL